MLPKLVVVLITFGFRVQPDMFTYKSDRLCRRYRNQVFERLHQGDFLSKLVSHSISSCTCMRRSKKNDILIISGRILAYFVLLDAIVTQEKEGLCTCLQAIEIWQYVPDHLSI